MRVMSDVSPLQIEPTRHRGIGQYTAGVLNALLQRSGLGASHLLLANGHLLQPTTLPTDTEVDWRLYYGDYRLEDYRPEECLDHIQPYAEYWEAQLDRFSPDVLHIHNPFEWDAPLHSPHSGVPTVLTVYDLIPLRLKKHYLQQSPVWMRRGYRHLVDVIRQVDQIIAISEHTRRDIIELLGVDPERIRVAHAGPSALTKLCPNRKVADNLRTQFDLREGFVLNVSGYDYRKNLTRTLQSYSLLDPVLRRQYPLVVVCRLLPTQEEELRELAEELGIGNHVVLTNYVSDEELAALYRMASVQFFPSIYEGFGMPVLDAMCFGLPVVSSQVSSLPEVAGDAALLVDPFDTEDMAVALARVLKDGKLRGRMRERGLSRASTFSWAETARVFHRVYEEIDAPAGKTYSSPSWKPRLANTERLALVSPLPPQLSGIADFSYDLLRALREHLPVTAFVGRDALRSVRRHVEGPVECITRLPHMVCRGEIDGVLYQIGNSAFHDFILPYLVAVPGVVELHDGILHGLVHSLTLQSGCGEDYRRELSYSHGRLGRAHAEEVIKGLEPPALYSMTANRRVVNHAASLIVHNKWTAQAAACHGTNLPIKVINHPVAETETAKNLDRDQARLDLGIAKDVLMLATFGRLARNKRLQTILRAFSRLREEVSNARLFLVGKLDPSSSDFDIPKLLEDLDVADSVEITGYVERSRFVAYMAAADIALNLRYPHAGETSGTLVRLLSAGIPTITSNVGAFAEFPDDCCWKVDVDPTEENLLLAYLRRLAEDKSLRRQMGLNAIEFAQAQIPTWKQAAPTYLDFIEESLTSQAALLPRVQVVDEVPDSIHSLGLKGADVSRRRTIWDTVRQVLPGGGS